MLWWGLGLLLAALLVVVLEFFVPSAGLLSVLACGLGIASVVCFWRVSQVWGLTSLAAIVLLTPLIVGFFFKIYPDTPMGRRMILGNDRASEEDPLRVVSSAAEASAMVGKEGVAISELRPAGTVRIGSERHEAISEHGMIAVGSAVRVTAEEGGRLRVREVG